MRWRDDRPAPARCLAPHFAARSVDQGHAKKEPQGDRAPQRGEETHSHPPERPAETPRPQTRSHGRVSRYEARRGSAHLALARFIGRGHQRSRLDIGSTRQIAGRRGCLRRVVRVLHVETLAGFGSDASALGHVGDKPEGSRLSAMMDSASGLDCMGTSSTPDHDRARAMAW